MKVARKALDGGLLPDRFGVPAGGFSWIHRVVVNITKTELYHAMDGHMPAPVTIKGSYSNI